MKINGHGSHSAANDPAPQRAVLPLAGHPGRRSRTITWAGRLIVLYGTAHTFGALTALGAAKHAGAWFGGELWGDDLANMSPAMSAYWLSVNSFGLPLVVVGLTVLWLDRRGITPPAFIAWTLGTWTVADAAVSGPGIGQGMILLVATTLLLVAARRTKHSEPTRSSSVPSAASAP